MPRAAAKPVLTIAQALDALEAVESLIEDLRTEYELNEGVSDHTIGYTASDPAEDLLRNADNEEAARQLVQLGISLTHSPSP